MTSFVYEPVTVAQFGSFQQAIFEARVVTSKGGATTGASVLYYSEEGVNSKAIAYVIDGGSITALGKSYSGSSSGGNGGR